MYCVLDFTKKLQIFFQKAMEKKVYQVIKILLKIYNALQKVSRIKLDLNDGMEHYREIFLGSNIPDKNLKLVLYSKKKTCQNTTVKKVGW